MNAGLSQRQNMPREIVKIYDLRGMLGLLIEGYSVHHFRGFGMLCDDFGKIAVIGLERAPRCHQRVNRYAFFQRVLEIFCGENALRVVGG